MMLWDTGFSTLSETGSFQFTESTGAESRSFESNVLPILTTAINIKISLIFRTSIPRGQ